MIEQLALRASIVIDSIALRFGTGNAPGNPKHVGHKLMFGTSVSTTAQLQNILELVFNSTCVSIPIVGIIFISCPLVTVFFG